MKLTLVLEQTLGHITHTKNLQRAVAQDSAIEPEWLMLDFAHSKDKNIYARLENLPVIRNNWTMRAGLKAEQALKKAARPKPDCYFFHTQTVSVFSAPRLAKTTPVVISLDATPINYDTVGSAYGHKPGNAAVEWLKFKLNQRALQSATKLVTWCEWAKKSLIFDYGVKAEIAVIPPGTDLSLWRRSSNSASTTGQAIKLLFVGGAFKRKGGQLLLDVFRQNFKQDVELHLVTQEKVKLDEVERNRIFVYNNITANSPEMQALFKTADVFVLPTEADCLPVVLAEAMAASLPIVTTDVGAISEAVTNGYNGFLINQSDERALAKALSELVQNRELRLTMGENGYKRAVSEHDAFKNGQHLLDWCKSCVPSLVAPEFAV